MNGGLTPAAKASILTTRPKEPSISRESVLIMKTLVEKAAQRGEPMFPRPVVTLCTAIAQIVGWLRRNVIVSVLHEISPTTWTNSDFGFRASFGLRPSGFGFPARPASASVGEGFFLFNPLGGAIVLWVQSLP